MDNSINKKLPTKSLKSRLFTFVLYPDNAYHMQYLHYLEANATGFYIIHSSGDDLVNIPYAGFISDIKQATEKKHIHVWLQFKNPRTLNGFLKSLPRVRYYKDEKTKRFFTLYDIPYINLPLQEVIKPIIEHAEIINDTFAMAQYFIHKDFNSVALGKKQYSISDIKLLDCDVSYLNKFYTQNELTDSDIIDILYQILSVSDNKTMFLQLCAMHSNPSVLKYVQSHAYFINTFIFDTRKEVLTND